MHAKNLRCNNMLKKNQLLSQKKTILHTLPITLGFINMSNALNKYLAVMSSDFLKAFGRVN